MPEASAFVRIAGDGLAAEWPCVVTGFVWRCNNNGDQCLIYDGLDSTSGKVFAKLIGGKDTFYPINLGGGVRFESGVYVDQSSKSCEITVLFRQVE